jgi:2-oxoglutarate dehydrogenase E1 component
METWKKPLIVFTPKSLLRSARSQSKLEEFATGRFERVLASAAPADPKKARRILLCSGKVAVDLEARCGELKIDDVAVLRIEQLYPLKHETLARALAPFVERPPAVWVQEEPVNMGAWRYLLSRYPEGLPGGLPLTVVSRPESASPATGSARVHREEQEELLSQALGL